MLGPGCDAVGGGSGQPALYCVIRLSCLQREEDIMAERRDSASEDLGEIQNTSVRYITNYRGSNEMVSAILDGAKKMLIVDNQAEMESYIIRHLLTEETSDSRTFATLQQPQSYQEIQQLTQISGRFSVPPPLFAVPPLFSVPPARAQVVPPQLFSVPHARARSDPPQLFSVPHARAQVVPLPLFSVPTARTRSDPPLPTNSLFRKFDPYEMLMPVRSNSSRSRRNSTSCAFCKKNGETVDVYRSHNLREAGLVTCPQLRDMVCELCGATGDWAHTRTYCANNINALPVTNMLRETARRSDGKVRRRGK